MIFLVAWLGRGARGLFRPVLRVIPDVLPIVLHAQLFVIRALLDSRMARALQLTFPVLRALSRPAQPALCALVHTLRRAVLRTMSTLTNAQINRTWSGECSEMCKLFQDC